MGLAEIGLYGQGLSEMMDGLLIGPAIHIEHADLQVQLARVGILAQLLDELVDVVVR